MSLRTAVLVASVTLSVSAWAQQSTESEEFTLPSWTMKVLSHRPRNVSPAGTAATATPGIRDEQPYFGVTIWRLRVSRPSDDHAVRKSIRYDGPIAEWTPERFPVSTPIPEGQKLLIGIEVTHPGFIYVIRRSTYSVGVNGPSRLVFPLPSSRPTANRVAPGQIIQVPPPDDEASHFTIERTGPDHISETFVVVFSPSPLPELLGGSADLSEAVLKEWTAKWRVPVRRLASSHAGIAVSSAEISAVGGARLLAQDDPPPLTIYHCYRCEPRSDGALLFDIDLPIERSPSTLPRPSGLLYRAAPGPQNGPAARGGGPVGPLVTQPQNAAPPTFHAEGLTGKVTSGAFLTPLQREQPGYGLYSYLLFGSRPESLSSAHWQRFEQAIAAFLDIPSATEIAQYVAAARINISFLPVIISQRELPLHAQPRVFHFDLERLAGHATEHQAAGKTTPPGPDTACILVSNYDYARAQVLLSVFAEPHQEGPYIVSVAQPLSTIYTPPRQYLYQDLSSVPPELIRLWVNEFVAQSREQEFWKTRTKEQFILRLRTTIGVASNQVADFAGAIKWTFATLTPGGR
jgi:hypothetical protein